MKFVIVLIVCILILLAGGCVTTAAQIGTGVAAGSSSASVTHH
jgi:uncharacterized protein YceK